jgi:hypothetical protein
MIPLVRFGATWWLVALTGTLLTAGCTGSEPTTTPAHVELGSNDLAGLVAVSPTATGWRSTEWRVMPGASGPRTRAELDRGLGLDPSDPSFEIQATLTVALQDAGFVVTRQRVWQGEAGVAHSFATLFETREGAQDALGASRDFAADWYPEIERRPIRDVDAADGLGDKSWAVQGGRDEAGFVELAWVRGTAQLGVYLNCSPCSSDLAAAARSWADAIDAEALATAAN